MKQVIRAQYRAALKTDIAEKELQKAVLSCRSKMEKEVQKEKLLTGGMFRYKNMLFLYMECIVDTETYAAKEVCEGQKYIEQLIMDS